MQQSSPNNPHNTILDYADNIEMFSKIYEADFKESIQKWKHVGD